MKVLLEQLVKQELQVQVPLVLLVFKVQLVSKVLLVQAAQVLLA